MAENTKIEWAKHTVNFWWGCMKVSEGCANCYAETLAHRFGKSIWGPAATTDRERKSGAIANLRKWNKQAGATGEVTRVFAQSMSDFFEDHRQLVPWRAEACAVIEECSRLVVMLLTKRPENIMHMVPAHWLESWPSHVWIGTSVENQEQANKRIPKLLKVPAAVRFLSCEPLLGAVRLPYDLIAWGCHACGEEKDPVCVDGVWRCRNCFSTSIVPAHPWIDWVIVGGESGHSARPMHPDWARSIRDQCQAAGVPFLFKQWGEWLPYSQTTTRDQRERFAKEQSPGGSQTYFGARIAIGPQGAKTGTTPGIRPESIARIGKTAAGRLLDGRTWDEFPVVTP